MNRLLPWTANTIAFQIIYWIYFSGKIDRKAIQELHFNGRTTMTCRWMQKSAHTSLSVDLLPPLWLFPNERKYRRWTPRRPRPNCDLDYLVWLSDSSFVVVLQSQQQRYSNPCIWLWWGQSWSMASRRLSLTFDGRSSWWSGYTALPLIWSKAREICHTRIGFGD